jgi:ABC-type phosphate transport system permease subunit
MGSVILFFGLFFSLLRTSIPLFAQNEVIFPINLANNGTYVRQTGKMGAFSPFSGTYVLKIHSFF